MKQTYFDPISSSVTFSPSTIVKEPIPGNTRLFNISVPNAVALIKQTLEFSNSF